MPTGRSSNVRFVLKRVGLALLIACCLTAVAGWLTRPASLIASTDRVDVNEDLTTYLAASDSAERQAYGITDGAEKRIRWAGEAGQRTDYAVIYLHGFSATRQEIAPVPEQVAAALGANLFETRLAGHGRESAQLDNIEAEQWIHDGAEALAIGKALGDKLILLGTSTGATLALAMAKHPDFDAVDTLVFISPNFGPASSGSEVAIGPFGPQLVRALVGEYHQWEPANDAQAKYWTWRYPTTAIVEMMRLVKLAVRQTPEIKVNNALLIYSPKDDVVSVKKLLAGFESLQAEQKYIHSVDEPSSISAHVLAGDILAPESNAATAAVITQFLQGDGIRGDG